MQSDQNLLPGFISIEDAIALIKKDERDDATVDLQFLANNIPYMKVKQTYNIRLMKTIDGRATRTGTAYVIIHTEYDRQILLKAIREAFEARTNIQLNVENIGINHVTSMIDQEKQATDPRPRSNAESTVKVGDDISNPYEQTLQGV